MQYSPKLKKAAQDIKRILKKNDIAGIVILHTTEGPPLVSPEKIYVHGFTEFLFHINTTYSAASFENDHFKVKGKAIHYPNKQERDIKVAGAVNMLEHLSKWSTELALQTVEMSNKINEIVQVDKNDDPGGFTSHSQQNN